jgi:phospholipid/cholesterol/gamma-HCH transport system permease protein
MTAAARAEEHADAPPTVRTERDGERLVVRLGGRIVLAHIEAVIARLGAVETGGAAALAVDLGGVEALDSAGAWVIFRFMRPLRQAGVAAELSNASEAQRALLARMEPEAERRTLAREMVSPVRALIERVGSGTIEALQEGRRLVSFFGLTTVTLLNGLLQPHRLRAISLLSHIERIGLDAMPIVGLLSFLIGVVVAYVGASQLRVFGAELYTVNMIGIIVLRELGVLMTSIMVAGRSGSAFTAEIGTMKVNQEVDAMKTLGMDPMEVLVLPRLLAMMVALPLLAFYSNVMAIMGGGIICVSQLGLTGPQFLEQLHDALTLPQLWVGLVKAPVFAFLTAMVGCYEGLKVSGSAESVGVHTTQAVVVAIFLVIVADAVFAILFNWLNI